MSTKNGLTGNDPGAASCTATADPMRIVLITTLTEMSHATLRRNPGLVASTIYVSLLIRSKIGMYIAITMPPTTPPSTAIMIGSSRVRRPATAVSTSSS